MDISYSVSNLRAIQDSGWVTLKPLTLLVGANSSGKSTFIRSFPLIRQSIETRTSSLVLWYSDVDFGSFATAKNRLSEDNSIYFGFRAKEERDKQRRIRLLVGNKYIHFTLFKKTNFTIRYVLSSSHDTDYISSIEIECTETAGFVFKYDREAENFIIHRFNAQVLGQDFPLRLEAITSAFFAPIWLSFSGFGEQYDIDQALLSFLDAELGYHAHGNMKPSKRKEVLRKLLYLQEFSVAELEKLTRPSNSAFLRKIASVLILELRGVTEPLTSVALYLYYTIHHYYGVAPKLASIFSDVHYIGPYRANAQRFYRAQNLAIDRIDKSGANLSAFLSSMIVEEKRLLNIWFERLFGCNVDVRKNEAHIEIILQTKMGNINIADSGYGISQILPIFAALMIRKMGPNTSDPLQLPAILAMEQPELHLHPKQQAEMGSILLSSIDSTVDNNSVCLIVETHSEHLINRIGELISQGAASANDVSIIFFENESPLQSTTREVKFSDEGYLIDWPHNFFLP